MTEPKAQPAFVGDAYQKRVTMNISVGDLVRIRLALNTLRRQQVNRDFSKFTPEQIASHQAELPELDRLNSDIYRIIRDNLPEHKRF